MLQHRRKTSREQGEKGAACSQGERPQKEWNVQTPQFRTSSFLYCEKMRFCCLSHSFCGILLLQTQKTNIITGTRNLKVFNCKKRLQLVVFLGTVAKSVQRIGEAVKGVSTPLRLPVISQQARVVQAVDFVLVLQKQRSHL